MKGSCAEYADATLLRERPSFEEALSMRANIASSIENRPITFMTLSSSGVHTSGSAVAVVVVVVVVVVGTLAGVQVREGGVLLVPIPLATVTATCFGSGASATAGIVAFLGVVGFLGAVRRDVPVDALLLLRAAEMGTGREDGTHLSQRRNRFCQA
jgi:hypothetical protein